MRILLTLIILLSFGESKAQLVVNSNVTNTALVSQHLLGPGVCAKNIRWTGTQTQRGTFNCTNACNVGFSSGILITSGTVNNALGPNNAGNQGTRCLLCRLHIPGSMGFWPPAFP